MVAIVKESPCYCAAVNPCSVEAPEELELSHEATPSTVASDSERQGQDAAGVGFADGDDDSTNESTTVGAAGGDDESTPDSTGDASTYDSATENEDVDEEDVPRQLGAGLYSDDDLQRQQPSESSLPAGISEDLPEAAPREPAEQPFSAGSEGGDGAPCQAEEEQEVVSAPFTPEETLLIFDWDDTVLPSTWLQQNGLRLDSSSQPTAQHREVLGGVAAVAARAIATSRRHGTVVLVTNAERGWIELSCQKFLPTLYPLLEGVKIVSARTSYEGPQCSAPLQWKLRAFAVEITNHFGSDVLGDPSVRKNTMSLGDSLHEREALLVAARSLPNCRTKALKFVERPDISQICKQLELVVDCFQRIVHHDGDLDLCIRCP